tara:strand:+ start:78 stop:236 length:159 start_codon:yes stop_codon:yes gene_type:complete
VRGFAVINDFRVRGFAALSTALPQRFKKLSGELFKFNLTYDKSETAKQEYHH